MFGANPAIVGTTIRLDVPSTVVGVIPDGFDFPAGRMSGSPVVSDLAQSSAGWRTDALDKVGVLFVASDGSRDGVTATTGGGGSQRPVRARGTGALRHQRRRDAVRLALLPGPCARRSFALFAAVGLLLLIACANVSGLMLTRVSSRRQDDAVRLALGASSGTLARQWALETAVLFVAGGLLGLGAGQWLTRALVALAPPDAPVLSWRHGQPAGHAVHADRDARRRRCCADWRRSGTRRRPALVEALNTVRSTQTRRTFRARSAAGARCRSVLAPRWCVTATLVVRSFVNMRNLDLGFTPGRVPQPERRAARRRQRPGERVGAGSVGRISALPGVEAAGAVYLRPLALSPIGQETWVVLEGQTNDGDQAAEPDAHHTGRHVRVFLHHARPSRERAVLHRRPMPGGAAAGRDRRRDHGPSPLARPRSDRAAPAAAHIHPRRSRADLADRRRRVVSDVSYRGLNDLRLDVYDAALQSATQANRPRHPRVRRSARARTRGAGGSARGWTRRRVIDRVSTLDAIVARKRRRGGSASGS